MIIVDINGTTRDCEKIYPDPNYPGFMRVEFKTAVRSHHVWYPIADFIANNPSLAHLATNAPRASKDIVGTVSKSSSNTLTDKNQSWPVGEYKGFPIWISRGKGEGQLRQVLANSKNTVTIATSWDILPDKTSQYVLSLNIHDPQPLGNTLPGKETV